MTKNFRQMNIMMRWGQRSKLYVQRSTVNQREEVNLRTVNWADIVDWCLEHDVVPFDARFHLTVPPGVEAPQDQAGGSSTFTHLDAVSSHPTLADGGAWDLDLQMHPTARAAVGIIGLEIGPDGGWTLYHEGGDAQGTLSCTSEELMLSPQAFLETLIVP